MNAMRKISRWKITLHIVIFIPDIYESVLFMINIDISSLRSSFIFYPQCHVWFTSGKDLK